MLSFFFYFLSSETSVLGCFRGHLYHLRLLCHSLVFGCEGAKRYEPIGLYQLTLGKHLANSKTMSECVDHILADAKCQRYKWADTRTLFLIITIMMINKFLSFIEFPAVKTFSCLIFLFCSVVDYRDRAKEITAPQLLPGHVSGDEPWTLHQTGHRLPLHLSGLHGIILCFINCLLLGLFYLLL